MRLVCLSDTHKLHDRLVIPDGDVLIHAGDMSGRGSLDDIARCGAFFARLPHRHKVIIAGNHDFSFEDERAERARAALGDVVYLQDQAAVIDGVKFYGSPWQPRFFDWAFNLDRGAPLKAKWDLIPADTDVLITHGPPQGIGDQCYDGARVGCEELLAALGRVRPRVHVFGHIHEAYGKTELRHADGRVTICVNASTCDLRYRAANPPVVIDI